MSDAPNQSDTASANEPQVDTLISALQEIVYDCYMMGAASNLQERNARPWEDYIIMLKLLVQEERIKEAEYCFAIAETKADPKLYEHLEALKADIGGNDMRLDNPEDKQGSGTSPNRGSSLHTKLQTILDDEVNNLIREGEGVDPKSYFGIDNDDIIAQILQEVKKYLEAGGEL